MVKTVKVTVIGVTMLSSSEARVAKGLAFKDATGAGGNPPLVVDISSTCQQCVQRTEGGKTSRLGILSCRAPGHFTHFLSHYESM